MLRHVCVYVETRTGARRARTQLTHSTVPRRLLFLARWNYVMTDEDVYERKADEWDAMTETQRQAKALQYLAAYPIREHVFSYRKYVAVSGDIFRAYLRWLWVDKKV